jgi:hypothetical protein
MGNWQDVKSFLVNNLGGEEKSPRLVAVTRSLQPGRPLRTTYVSSAEDFEGAPWVSIDAIIGQLAMIDIIQAVRLAGEKVCGGLATMPIGHDEYLVLRHAMPISEVAAPGTGPFLDPFYAIAGGASEMADALTRL